MRVANRNRNSPGNRNQNVGFPLASSTNVPSPSGLLVVSSRRNYDGPKRPVYGSRRLCPVADPIHVQRRLNSGDQSALVRRRSRKRDGHRAFFPA